MMELYFGIKVVLGCLVFLFILGISMVAAYNYQKDKYTRYNGSIEGYASPIYYTDYTEGSARTVIMYQKHRMLGYKRISESFMIGTLHSVQTEINFKYRKREINFV